MEKYPLYNEFKSSGHKKSWDLETINKHFRIDKKKNYKIKLLQSSVKNHWAFISNLHEF